jgi:hypothetical protein
MGIKPGKELDLSSHTCIKPDSLHTSLLVRAPLFNIPWAKYTAAAIMLDLLLSNAI